jgi:hypothetical protein
VKNRKSRHWMRLAMRYLAISWFAMFPCLEAEKLMKNHAKNHQEPCQNMVERRFLFMVVPNAMKLHDCDASLESP